MLAKCRPGLGRRAWASRRLPICPVGGVDDRPPPHSGKAPGNQDRLHEGGSLRPEPLQTLLSLQVDCGCLLLGLSRGRRSLG